MTWGIYVHVPWCRVRCPYCAFHVERDDGDVPWMRFVDAVRTEHSQRISEYPGTASTLYLGGGTPSRMPADAVQALRMLAPSAREVTLETNPEDLLDPAWLDARIEAGVTRVSLGVQTLSQTHARRLGRAHTPPEARDAMAHLASAALTSWSADLMFGLSDQTLDDLERDLTSLLDHAPPHVSLYGLTVEPGTPYARAASSGALAPANDELWRRMLDLILDRLENAGLRRYEVSNFARPGHESRHNRGYWEGRPYLGLGPSAHGLAPDGRRWVNTTDTAAYLSGSTTTASQETPSAEQRATDRLISGLRGVHGLDLSVLAKDTGFAPNERAVSQLVRAGLLTAGPRTALTREGLYVADGVTAALARALTPASPARAG